ncbi:MAG: gliding motility-associated C-terminal domain-containing protein [Bacteroidales bacterium]|nr:gliding motility-associated C-terminal domain-containing protein [Bacteroidales bacterium]MCB9012653.1 gliding motility-associated C-terminal domain-containing protein [Bacteroidales bacterium]
MKKRIFLLLLILLPIGVYGQSITVGATGADFSSFEEAFFALNNIGSDLGDIIIEVVDNTVETSTAVILASGWDGLSTYNSITIYPVASGLSISGNFNGPLIEINGAANVTIDGRVNQAGPADLLISNTNTGTVASTLKFAESAHNNTIKYCQIKGSQTGLTGGVILFSTSLSGGGNSNNIIDNNFISNAGGNRPINAVYSLGSSGFENSGNSIINNEFYNFLKQGTASNGIFLSSFTTSCSISGNSFYENSSFVPTADVPYCIVKIDNTSGNNFSVSGNYIGGSAALCGGASWTKTASKNNLFYAVYLNVGTATASNVNNNTIKNFSWNNSSNASWYGINIAGGNVNTGTLSGNILGDPAVSGSLTYSGSGGNTAFFGINYSGSGIVNCDNNSVSNLLNNSAGSGNMVVGINISGSLVPNRVNANFIQRLFTSGLSSNSSIYGIRVNNGATTYSNNLISLNDNAPATLYGIYETGSAGNNNNLYFNTVYIGGAPTSDNKNSYALYSAVSTNIRDFRNNIFINERSNAGAGGTNYAIYIANAGGSLTIDYNDYFVTGVGGVFGYLASNIADIAAWKAATGQDANSLGIDPQFNSPGGVLQSDYQPNAVLSGVSGTGITTDITGATRNPGATSMGAYEAGPCTNPTSGGSISAAQSGCDPFDPDIITNTGSPSGYLGSLEYKWQLSTTGNSSGFSDITSSNSAQYNPPILSQNTWYKRLSRVNCSSDWSGAAESNVIPITVNPLPTASVTGTLTSCAATTLTAVTDAPSASYVWYQDYLIIPGQTSSTLLAGSNGVYSVTVTNLVTTCKKTSALSTVSIIPVPSAILTGTLTACVSTTLTAISDAGTPSFVWFKDNVIIPGQVSSSLDVSASGSYKFKVTDAVTTCEQTSAASNVTIYPLPTASITGTLIACGSTTLTAVSNAVSPSYVWYKDDIVINGQTAATLVVTSDGDYKVKVKNGVTGCEQTSAPSTVLINPLPAASVSGVLNSCESTTLTAITDAVSPSYVWYKDNVIVPGQTSPTLPVNVSGDYKVKVTNGVSTCEQTSAVSNVTIMPLPTATITGTLTACETTTLTAVSDAASPTYLWYKDNVIINGETSSTIGITSSGDYKFKVSNGVTTCELTSAASTVTINPLPLNNLVVNGTGNVCAGTGTNISVDLSETGVSYQLRNVVGNINIGSAVPGTGGTILLPTGNLNTDTEFNILASNLVTGCSNELLETENLLIDSPSTGGSVSGSGASITYGTSTGDMTLSGETGTVVKWQKLLDVNPWEDITNSSLIYNEFPSAAGTWQYRAEIKNGVCPSDFSDPFSITVLPKSLTITANDISKIYGTDFTFSGNEFTTSGLINNDTVLNLTISSPGSIATAGTLGSPYIISCTGASGTGLNNYTISYLDGSFSVTKANLTATADPLTKVYGTANPILTLSYSGFQNGEDESVLTSVPVLSTTIDVSSPAGVYSGAIIPSGGSADNYDFTYVASDFTVLKADQVITFDPLTSKTYGDIDFDLAATASSGLPVSFLSSDISIAGILNGSVHLTGAGTATITATQPGDNNYNAAPEVTQNLNVNKALLLVTAQDQTKTYGSDNPIFIASYSGFIGSDEVASLDVAPIGTTSAEQYSLVGEYPVIFVGGEDNNYEFSYINAVLTITKANLTFIADNKSRGYLEENPVLSYTVSGLQGTDDLSVLDILPEITTTALQNSDAGDYPISLSGGNDNCYAYLYTDGVLTINKLQQIITLTEIPGKLLKGESISLEASATSGLPVLFESLDIGIASVSGNQLTGISKGTAQFRAYNDGNQNYLAAEVLDSIEITTTHKDILNLFTPNNDGYNDLWELPELQEWGKSDVKVYNRWGKMVYSNPDYNNQWDGTSDGSQLPEGAYYFVIQTQNSGIIKGTVNIVR